MTKISNSKQTEPLAKPLNLEEIVIPGNPGEGRGRPGIQPRSERDSSISGFRLSPE